MREGAILAQSAMSFDTLGVDSVLQVLAYVNARGLARVACGGRMGAIMAHEAQQRPALVVVRGTLDEVAKALPERLAARPNLAVVLYGDGGLRDVSRMVLDFVARRLPPGIEVLGAKSSSLLCACSPVVAQHTHLQVCEGRLTVGLLLATLPEATSRAFHLKPHEVLDLETLNTSSDFSEHDGTDDEDGSAEETAAAAACVSSARGVAAVAPAGAASSDCKATAGTKRLSLLEELFALDPPPQVVVIHLAMHAPECVVERIQAAFPKAVVIGGIVMGQEVLARGKFSASGSVGRGAGILAISGNAPVFAMASSLDGGAKCAHEDVVAKLQRAKERAHAEERDVLGALLFTCLGRGLQAFGREANDARLFHEAFPGAPLLGYYAGGEIGPRISRDEKKCFVRGNARLQAFTAVFAFFLAPRRHSPSTLFQRAVLYGEVHETFQELFASRDVRERRAVALAANATAASRRCVLQ